MSAEPTDSIDQGIKRLEWSIEDINSLAAKAGDAILDAVPQIRETHPEEALILLNAFVGAYLPSIDESIAENECEIAQEEAEWLREQEEKVR